MLFFRLLALLIVSYVVFLVLAHVTQRRPAPAPEEGEGDVEGFTTPLGVAYPDADAPLLAADDAPLRVLKDLHVDRFVTYAHRTLMANADLEDGPVHRRDPDAQESIPAFVRRCVQAAHKDAACVAVAVFAPSETDVRCVCKRRRRPRSHRRRRSGSSDERAPVVVDAHAAWTLRETEPQEAGLVFVKADVLRDGRVVPPEDDKADHQAPVVVIKEVDSATSAKGFALDQPTTYDRDEPPVSLLDKYGHFDSPPTVWSAPQPDAPKCLVNACDDGTRGCPVQLSDTYATPATNSRVGSILPPFTYTECR